MVSLTWNFDNQFASGIYGHNGLTDLGKDVVKELETYNVVLDVSHLNDKSFYDVCHVTSRPCVASHSNCRSICNNLRNLSDDQIRVLISKNGLIGINLYPLFINGSNTIDFIDIAKHIDHLIKLGAERCIALGTDFDGCNMSKGFSKVSDINKLYQYISFEYGKSFSDDIFFNNAYNFFINME